VKYRAFYLEMEIGGISTQVEPGKAFENQANQWRHFFIISPLFDSCRKRNELKTDWLEYSFTNKRRTG
jgi:hypothetical protein